LEGPTQAGVVVRHGALPPQSTLVPREDTIGNMIMTEAKFFVPSGDLSLKGCPFPEEAVGS
jgi:hypothetical protein